LIFVDLFVASPVEALEVPMPELDQAEREDQAVVKDQYIHQQVERGEVLL
jgi:hypothetical protein